jgi:hypothetical protein
LSPYINLACGDNVGILMIYGREMYCRRIYGSEIHDRKKYYSKKSYSEIYSRKKYYRKISYSEIHGG